MTYPKFASKYRFYTSTLPKLLVRYFVGSLFVATTFLCVISTVAFYVVVASDSFLVVFLFLDILKTRDMYRKYPKSMAFVDRQRVLEEIENLKDSVGMNSDDDDDEQNI